MNQSGRAGTATPAGADPFRPSEYTGMLLQVLKSHAAHFRRGAGLDMGPGRGALLAMLGMLGVERLYGVDIDPQAIAASRNLLDGAGLGHRAELLVGNLWAPLAGMRFDIIVANLPQFASTEPSDPLRSVHWSMGGADARRLIDPFVEGLAAHLQPDGVAFMTHNVFADTAKTARMLAGHGLVCRPVLATTTILHPVKSALLNPAVRASHIGRTIHRIGPYEFADIEVLEIRAAGRG
jgi:methylase of polypeptide subunit release factors